MVFVFPTQKGVGLGLNPGSLPNLSLASGSVYTPRITPPEGGGQPSL